MLSFIQGSQVPFNINVTSQANDGLPLDLTGNIEITVCFKTASSLTELTKTGSRITVVDLVLGKITGTLTVAETTAMPEENNGIIEVVVDFGAGKIVKAQILNGFVVIEKACSA